MEPDNFDVQSTAEMPEDFLDLFERRSFANLATVDPDGSVHVTVVWTDYDGTYVLVNTAEGRRKERNLRRNPAVGLTILDPENPYRYLSIQGEVEELTSEGAHEHIDKLARRYMVEVEDYPFHGQEIGGRVLAKIRPYNCITYTTNDERLLRAEGVS